MAKKKTASFESAVQGKADAFRKALEGEVNGIVASAKKELTAAAAKLNQLGGPIKIAEYFKAQKIKGQTGENADCPVARFLTKVLDGKFGANYFDNSVEVDSAQATLDCALYVDGFGDLGDTITVKLGKNVQKFISNFDESSDSDKETAYSAVAE